jgi:TPR repeat protein
VAGAESFRGSGGRWRASAGYVERLRRAARAGDAEARWELGTHHHDGLYDARGRVLVRRNRRLAARWFAAAAEAGHAGAMNNLAVLLADGDGVPRDLARPLALHRRCLRTDPGLAASNIAMCYRNRGKNALAARWMRRAVEEGDGESLVDLGYALLYGIGVRRDPAQAVALFRRAIRSSSIIELWREEAMVHLASAHARGEGVPRSVSRAISCLARASKDGDYPEAARGLALVRAGRTAELCRCRRGRVGPFPGNATCPRHRAGRGRGRVSGESARG